MAKRTFKSDADISVDSYDRKRETKYEMPKKKDKKGFIIIGSVAGALVLVACVCLFFAFREKKEDADIDDMWDDVRDTASVSDVSLGTNNFDDSEDDYEYDESYKPAITQKSSVSSDTPVVEEDPMKRVIDWNALKKINSDVWAWIYIPGTQVDYPVMKEPVFGETFYLTHNIYKVAQKSGCIFIPAQIKDTVDDAHTLFYGHHMKNGSMFGSITKYKKEEYYKEHPYIYVYTPRFTQRYAVWTMEHVKSDHDVYTIPFTIDTEEYGDLLKKLEKETLYKTTMTDVTSHDRTVVLSTCDNVDRTGTGRFIVNGVLDAEVTAPKKKDKSMEPTDFSNDDSIVIEDDEYEGYDLEPEDITPAHEDTNTTVFFDEN